MATTEDHKPTAAERKRDDVIDQWFKESFSGSLLAQNTPAYNEVRAAVEDLKKRLK